MSVLNVGHVGIAGEVCCIVKREDGSVKEDTGFQRNLLLNQGLEFFGGDKGGSIFQSCAIGTGNSTPTANQTQLDNFLAIGGGVLSSSKYDYAPSVDNLYKTNKVCKYTFTGLNDVNVSEIGLVSQGTTSSNYYLCTRALLKDISGKPTTITILAGETLEVYYKLWRVISVLSVTTSVDMLDGKGGKTPYSIEIKPVKVGDVVWIESLGAPLGLNGLKGVYTTTSGLSDITTAPAYAGSALSGYGNLTYVENSYKRGVYINATVNEANTGLRTLWSDQFSSLPFQARFDSVGSNSHIPKTNLQTLSMPFEFSWGRYEGAL